MHFYEFSHILKIVKIREFLRIFKLPVTNSRTMPMLMLFAARNVTSEGALRGPQKKFSRLAIARHI